MHSQEWQDLYQFAISEQDNTRLPQRIAEARCAIFDRIEDRISRPDSDERRMLTEALNGLRVIQLECQCETRKKAS
jgi:hypothetical protein